MDRTKIKSFFKNYWWTIPLALIVLASIWVVFLIINYYWIQFHNKPISNELQNWGVFGDYFGGTLNPLLSIINICITISLTIIINKYANKNADKQIEAERRVAQIQLRHEALKELRDELNLNFNTWRQANNNLANAQNCNRTLTNFADNYNYLFDLNNINSFQTLVNIINKSKISIQNNNLVNILQDFMQADMGRQALLSELGEHVLI